MIILAGVDLVEIERIRRAVDKGGESFMSTIWTKREIAYSAGRVERLASRWGAKEATMKALGRGLGRIDPLDIEVRSVEGERPELKLHRSARKRAEELRVQSWSLSLSHESEFALAYATALAKES